MYEANPEVTIYRAENSPIVATVREEDVILVRDWTAKNEKTRLWKLVFWLILFCVID
jgi:hypothetical protein